MSVDHQLKHGVFWTAIERFSAQGIQFILSIVIARLLLPEDYGLIAMISLFIGLSQCLVDSGFVDALVQKRDKTAVDYNTAFYFNVIFGLLVFVLLFMAAPFIATFYEEPKLIGVTRVMGTLPLITSLRLVVKAKLMIEMHFKQLAIAGIISVIISGAIGLAMAYYGFGVWALVAQTVISYLCNAIFMWIYSRWIPSLSFSITSLKALWSFGSKLLATSVIDTLYVNIYGMLIGKQYSSGNAGLFNRSQNLAMFPALNISTVILKAFYPIECRIQDDEVELKRVFVNSIRIACFVVFPLLIGLAALAEPFILVVLKDKWIDAVPLLQILAISYMLNPLMLLNTSILSVKGRTDLSLKAEFIKKIAGMIIVFSLLPFGLKAICGGFILYSLADILIITFYVKKVMGISFLDEVKAVCPVFLLAVIMGGVTFGVSCLFETPVYRLMLGCLAGVVVYAGGAYILKLKELSLVLSVLKKHK